MFVGHPILPSNEDEEDDQNNEQNYYEGNRSNSLVENSGVKQDEYK